jgi:hypothetical protein
MSESRPNPASATDRAALVFSGGAFRQKGIASA